MYVAAEGNHIAKVSSSSLNEKKKHSFPAPVNKRNLLQGGATRLQGGATRLQGGATIIDLPSNCHSRPQIIQW
jgi:hypothetical protein